MTRVNPLSVAVAEGASIPIEGAAPQESPSAQVTVADVVTAGIPLPAKSKGVVVPVAEEDNPNVYIDGQDPTINAMFIGVDLLQTIGGGSTSPQVDREGCIPNPSYSP